LKNFEKGYIMLKFSDLTLAQKRFIVAVIEHTPALKKTAKITLKECGAIYDALREQREGVKGEKIGYPNWLFKANKIERGMYQLPVPTASELSDFAKALTVKTASPVVKAKVKVAKLAKAKAAPKTKPVAEKADTPLKGSRLVQIIDESAAYDEDVEDFNAILRENGIEV
jgi:hypothetical protein